MRRKPDLERICRHSLTNRIARRACAYDYRCAKCDFDQYFEEVWTVSAKGVPAEVQEVKGFAVPMDYYFHAGHTWARIENGGSIRIGLDDFALKLLGEAEALELPLMGNELNPGRPGWGLKRKGNSADVLSPVGGVITAVNPRVRETPALANREPYGDGWLFTVRSGNVKRSVTELMSDTATIDWVSAEVATLESLVEEVAGPLAADGGYFGEDIYGHLPDLGWDRLKKTFLKT
jgi:glycine cleavage system H lipoate-binding protein